MAPSHGNVCPNLNISHTHQPRQMHACRKRERGERKIKSGAVPKSSYLAYVRQKGCEKTIFLKFSSLPAVMYATSCKIQQRFSGTIILANKSSTSLSCTLRRMPMVGKPREICSIACEERETPASMLWKQRAVFRAISSFRVFRFPFLLSCIAYTLKRLRNR